MISKLLIKFKRPKGHIAHLKTIFTINNPEQSYDYTSTLLKNEKNHYLSFKIRIVPLLNEFVCLHSEMHLVKFGDNWSFISKEGFYMSLHVMHFCYFLSYPLGNIFTSLNLLHPWMHCNIGLMVLENNFINFVI